MFDTGAVRPTEVRVRVSVGLVQGILVYAGECSSALLAQIRGLLFRVRPEGQHMLEQAVGGGEGAAHSARPHRLGLYSHGMYVSLGVAGSCAPAAQLTLSAIGLLTYMWLQPD